MNSEASTSKAEALLIEVALVEGLGSLFITTSYDNLLKILEANAVKINQKDVTVVTKQRNWDQQVALVLDPSRLKLNYKVSPTGKRGELVTNGSITNLSMYLKGVEILSKNLTKVNYEGNLVEITVKDAIDELKQFVDVPVKRSFNWKTTAKVAATALVTTAIIMI